MIAKRLYQSIPPDAQTKADDNPTLLVSWWCTGFALAAILVRVGGRYVRTEQLFKEDRIMFWSVIPLLIRMGLVHVIMIWGTNNAITDDLTVTEIRHRAIGSRLVLASRIFYAAFIWTAKLTVAEFLRRIIGQHWRRSYEIGLQFIRYFLAATFVAVVIATLAECQPFDHYWQVTPDPGPKCRQGYAQLITMGVCDIITDVLLVAYPIPIIIAAAMPFKRKISLTLLFMLSLGLVAITAYRIPAVISRRGTQQFRTLLASLEILAAAGVSNAIVIGSFIRDRGVKKAKYKFGSTGGSSLDRTPTRGTARRTATQVTQHHWGSDAELVSDLGLSVHPSLQSRTNSVPRPAPVATPHSDRRKSSVNPNWQFPSKRDSSGTDTSVSEDLKYSVDEPHSPGPRAGDNATSNAGNTPRKMSFFDVGGLLDPTSPVASSRRTSTSVHAQDFASNPPSSSSSMTPLQPQQQPQHYASRRSSRAMLSDVGGLLSAHREESPASTARGSPSPTMTRNFSRGSTAYSGATPRFTTHSLAEEDGAALSQTTSGGTNHSLIAALATEPPGYHIDPRTRRGSQVPQDRRRSGPDDGMELMDAGGLLR